MKIRPVGAELFYVEGRTDRRRDTTKLRIAFRNFSKGPKNKILHYRIWRPCQTSPDRDVQFYTVKNPDTAWHK